MEKDKQGHAQNHPGCSHSAPRRKDLASSILDTDYLPKGFPEPNKFSFWGRTGKEEKCYHLSPRAACNLREMGGDSSQSAAHLPLRVCLDGFRGPPKELLDFISLIFILMFGQKYT